MIVSSPRELLWGFLNSRIGTPWSEDFRAIGAVRGDCLKGVIGYNGMVGRVCMMHSAIDDPSVVDRTFLRAIFSYPFEQLGMTDVLATVDESNSRAREIDERLGFKEMNRLEGSAMDGGDLLILRMRRSECRWLSHGRKEHSQGS